jgi:hypothetical protein
MSIWETIFSVAATRSDLRKLREETVMVSDTSALRERVAEAEAQLGRIELALEGLVEVLVARKLIAREEVALAIQRIDLADGVEDGRIGPDRADKAPPCPACARPLNPRRSHCLYCETPIDHEALKPKPPPPRLVSCTRCATTVPERTTWISETGVICTDCHYGRAPRGAVSLADSEAGGAGGLSLGDE